MSAEENKNEPVANDQQAPAEQAVAPAPVYTGPLKNGYAFKSTVDMFGRERPEVLVGGVPATNDNINHTFMLRMINDRQYAFYVDQYFVKKAYPTDHPYWKG